MSTSELWTNADGLVVRYGTEAGEPLAGNPGEVLTLGAKKQLVIDFTYDNLPGYTADLNNDGTLDGFQEQLTPAIPAYSYIESAILIATVDWATASSAALTIGLQQEDGTEIDNDGIDASIAASALDLGDVVNCDGALVGGTVSTGANRGFVRATNTNTFTTGAAKLVITYIPTQV